MARSGISLGKEEELERMNRWDITDNLRAAGNVERYHTWPTLKRQTVADHTYHVMRIYRTLFGTIPNHVVDHILFHDSPEVATGDIPFPVKKNNAEVRAAIETVEKQWRESQPDFVKSLRPTREEEEGRIKICDLLEMYEFGAYELAMGNKFAIPIIDSTYNVIAHKSEKLSADDSLAITRYITEVRATTKIGEPPYDV